MFWHVHHRAAKCGLLSQVVLATDDERIFSAAQALDVPAVMTAVNHLSGTDRVLEAAQKIGISGDTVVVNIQGDEPLLEPQMITQLIRPFANPGVQVSTLAQRIAPGRAREPNQVKVVFDDRQTALYFSRAPIPWDRDGDTGVFYGHIGLYAFRMEVLRRFVRLGRGRLEAIEKLEQLRLLENGIPIHVSITEHTSIGVDRPGDIPLVVAVLERKARAEKA